MPEVVIQPIGLGYLDELFVLHDTVYNELNNDQLYRSRSRDRLRTLLGNNALCLGAFLDGALAGYAGVRFPTATDEMLAAELGIKSNHLDFVAEFDGSCVLSQFRGSGIQKKLIEARLQASLTHGKVLSLSTVAYQNVFSLRNFLHYGMLGVCIHRMYDGYERLIMVRDHSSTIHQSAFDKSTIVSAELIDRDIKNIFESGGNLTAVYQQDNRWTYEFSWQKDLRGVLNWVERFNSRQYLRFNDVSLSAELYQIEYEGRWS